MCIYLCIVTIIMVHIALGRHSSSGVNVCEGRCPMITEMRAELARGDIYGSTTVLQISAPNNSETEVGLAQRLRTRAGSSGAQSTVVGCS